MARDLKQKASQATEDILDNAQSRLDEAEELVEELRSLKRKLEGRFNGSTLSRGADKLSTMAEDTGRTLRNAYDASLDQLEETTDYARETVQNNPLLTVAGAFVGGLLMGMLSRSSR